MGGGGGGALRGEATAAPVAERAVEGVESEGTEAEAAAEEAAEAAFPGAEAGSLRL